MRSTPWAPSDHGRIRRRFAVLVASAAFLLPAQAVWLAPPAAAVSCPTGTTSAGNGSCQVTFDASTAWTIPTGVSSVDVVAVGGGGGGGGNQDPRSSLPGAGGGGGGGAVVQVTYRAVTPGASATITVGPGGAGGLSGVNGTAGGTSSFVAGAVSVSAAGGSPGAGGFWGAPYVGGTGYGGASGAAYAGGTPKLVVGGMPPTWGTYFGGGGGGSSAPGGDAGELGGGNGGAGTVPSAGLFAGSSTAYAGGGGGGHQGTTTSPGDGVAGGGDGNSTTTSAGGAAIANTGGGGGGTASFTNGTGGDGGSGIVIVRFLVPGGSWTQTISFTSQAPSNAVYGGTYTPTATATSGLAVSFTSVTGSICSISAGVVTFTGVGTCTIDANQAGNTTYKPAPQVQQTFSVDKSSQMVGWNSPPPSNAAVGGTWTATGFSSSGLPVTFIVDSGSSSICSIDAHNLVTFTAPGYCAIRVTQAGNADYYPATPILQSFTVAAAAGPADQTISFSSTAPTNATVGGPTYTPVASATSDLAVALTIDASASSICSVDGGGVVSFLAAGTCVIDVNQGGNASYKAAAQVQQSFSVAAAPGFTPTGTDVAVTPAFTGGTSPVTVTFGTVTSAGTTSLTTGTLPPAPVPAGYLAGSETFFDLATTATYDGPITVCVSYAGTTSGPTSLLHYESGSWVDVTSSVDTSNQVICGTTASLSPFALVAVGQASQAVTFSSNAPTDARVGGPKYTPTASASSDLDVVLTIDSSSNSVCSIDGSGVVSFTAAGTCTIDANQAGDANYAAASQAQQSFSVGKGTQTITFTSTWPSDAEAGGGTYTPTATGGASGNPVVFTIDASATAVCSISGGVVSFKSAGSCVIDANQAGSTVYSAAPQVQQPFTVGTRNPGILYATPDGLTSGNCDSWENACQLRYPLGWAISGDQIWVAAGTYMPTISTDRNTTFQLRNGVAVYGGFAGSETSLDQRNANPATNGTVLSGDIGTPGSAGDNVYHVVTGSGTNATAALHGFTVTGGNANGGGASSDGAGMYNSSGSPTVRNVIFSANAASDAGGGMSNSASSPTVRQVAFSANTAGNYGGGMNNEAGSSPTLTDVTFSSNAAPDRTGGGMTNNNNSNPTLTNVTFSGNSAASGGAMANFRSSLTLVNATFTGNTARNGSVAYECAANLTIQTSILWGNSGGLFFYTTVCAANTTTITDSVIEGGWDGVGNISTDPLLGALGYHGGSTQTVPLLPGSPAIDRLDRASCPATDQRGVTRTGTGCDVGSYEAQAFSLSVKGGDNQSARVNTAFGSPLKISVTSPAGDPVVGGKVTFTAPASGASATFAGNPATITSDGTASVTGTTNGTGGSYEVTASAAGAYAPVTFDLTNTNPIPTFTFDLSTLTAKTYGDAGFSVATYTRKPADDSGAITFALGAGSIGCTVTSAGMVTLTGAAVDPAHCVINASLAADSTYLAAGPISQSFNIARAPSTVTVTCTVGAPYTYTGSAQTPCTAQATGAGMSPVNVTSSLTYLNNTNAGAATASASWAGDANHTGNMGSGGFNIVQASTSVLYTGGQIVTIPNPFTLSPQRSGPASCPISYELDTIPTTGVVGPYALGSGGSVSTTGWLEGAYIITVTLGGNANCLVSTDQATLTVASPGDTASGGGWYTLSGSGRVNMGFTVRQVPKASPVQYKGQFVLVNNGKWRLKGTLTTYAKTSSTGAAAGTGTLYWWSQSLNGGLGDWALASSNVAFTISFTGGTRKSTGSFGIHISYVPVASQPGSLPNAAPTALKGGNVTVN